MTSQQRTSQPETGAIYDAQGRYIAPPQPVLYQRPDGPWNQNAPVVDQVVETVCAWCPDFDRNDPKNATASHGICPTCVAREALGWAA